MLAAWGRGRRHVNMKFPSRLCISVCLILSVFVNVYFIIRQTCCVSYQQHDSRTVAEEASHNKRYSPIVKNTSYGHIPTPPTPHSSKPIDRPQGRPADNTTLLLPYDVSTASTRLPSNVSISPIEFKFFRKIFTIDSTTALENEQFTILTMTYQRSALLKQLIPHYCSTGPHLHKILIIWNDVDSSVPQYLKDITCEVKLEFILSKENKLTNRFIPYEEIETEAVFCIDDDRQITHQDLIFAFQSWQQLRHKVLGFERRTHTVLPDGGYVYGEKEDVLQKLGYSIVLSTNFILHRAYFEMFQMEEFMPRGIVRYVDEKMNCEDFAMCLMVADFLERISSTQSCCLVVKGKYYPSNLEEKNDGYQGLSRRGGRHYSERTKCLNDFRPFYKDGKLPLHYTQVKITHESKLFYSRRKKWQ